MSDKPLRALRRFCLECQGGHPPSVTACKDVGCLLYGYRRQQGLSDGAASVSDDALVGPSALSGPDPSCGSDYAASGLAAMARERGGSASVPDAALSGVGAAVPDHDEAVSERPEDGRCSDRPVRVIRRFCLLCGGSRGEVRACDARDACPLWSYRFGVLPATFKRVLARQRRSRSELTLPGLRPC